MKQAFSLRRHTWPLNPGRVPWAGMNYAVGVPKFALPVIAVLMVFANAMS
jgi:hypothetical protein